MTPNQYQKAAARTMPSFEQDLMIEKRAARNQGLIHALFGLCSESGEVADAIKKHVIYNQPLDTLNLKEELSDILWYVSLAATYLGANMEDIMQHNIDKLKLRYPEKFTEELAAKRLDKSNSEVNINTLKELLLEPHMLQDKLNKHHCIYCESTQHLTKDCPKSIM